MYSKKKMININKLTIFALSVTGIILDGNVADALYIVALFLWLWQPNVIGLEVAFLKKRNKK